MERLMNRVSAVLPAISTVSLLHLVSRSTLSCTPALTAHGGPSKNPTPPPAIFLPRTSCEAASREALTVEKRFAKLWSSLACRQHVGAFSVLFASFRSIGILTNTSHVICVSSSAGFDVAALQESGVDLIDFHPLVRSADPPNLPFFDDVFGLAFSADLAGALFLARFVCEMERPSSSLLMAPCPPWSWRGSTHCSKDRDYYK